MRTRISAVLLVAALGAGCAQPDAADDAAATDTAAQAAGDTDAGKQAVDSLRSAWVDAANRDDAAAVAAMYADDAIYIGSGGVVSEGRSAIQAVLGEGFGAGSDLEVNSSSTDGSGDIIYDSGDFSQTITTPDGQTMNVTGKYLVVSERQDDGSWKIVRHMSVVPTPPPVQD